MSPMPRLNFVTIRNIDRILVHPSIMLFQWRCQPSLTLMEFSHPVKEL